MSINGKGNHIRCLSVNIIRFAFHTLCGDNHRSYRGPNSNLKASDLIIMINFIQVLYTKKYVRSYVKSKKRFDRLFEKTMLNEHLKYVIV